MSKDKLDIDMKNGPHDNTEFAASYIPEFTTPEEFIAAKIEMLREHMDIVVDDEDIAFLKQYKGEYEINAAVKGIINKHWPLGCDTYE